jgi:hypothetical protein
MIPNSTLDKAPPPPRTASEYLAANDYDDLDPQEFFKNLNASLEQQATRKLSNSDAERKHAAALLINKAQSFANFSPNISPKDVKRTRELIRLVEQPKLNFWKKIKRLWARLGG